MRCTAHRLVAATTAVVAFGALGTAPALGVSADALGLAAPDGRLGARPGPAAGLARTPPAGPHAEPSTVTPTSAALGLGLATDRPAARMAAQIREALGSRADDVSVVVHDRRTGTVISHNRSLRNYTASIVKVMMLVALLDARRSQGRALTADDRALAQDMITVSDNDAATTLLRRAGGRAALDELAERLGMTGTTAAVSWGRTLTTAEDQVKLMDAIVAGKAVRGAADRRYVLGLMARVVPEQGWGAGTIPDEARAQLKNGWLPAGRRGWRVNSIGHVVGPDRDYTIAMLSYGNDSFTQGRRILDTVSRMIYDGVDDLETAPDGDETGRDATGDPGPGVETGPGPHAGATARVASEARPVVAGRAGLPSTAPPWLGSPGSAFPPYPAW